MWQSGSGHLRRLTGRRLALLAGVLLTSGLPGGARTTWPTPHQEAGAARDAPVRAQAQPLKDGGAAVTREMAGGDVHVYQLKLDAGQFACVLIDQRGIDVAAKVYGPDGGQVADVDGPSGMQGPEAVRLVAESAGSYRVEIRSTMEGAPRGSYEVGLKEVRQATARDRSVVAAQRAYAEGDRVRSQGTKESRQEAIRKYEEARRLYAAAGERVGEADALHNIGYMYATLGEKQKALDYYRQALTLNSLRGRRCDVLDGGLSPRSVGRAGRAVPAGVLVTTVGLMKRRRGPGNSKQLSSHPAHGAYL